MNAEKISVLQSPSDPQDSRSGVSNVRRVEENALPAIPNVLSILPVRSFVIFPGTVFSRHGCDCFETFATGRQSIGRGRARAAPIFAPQNRCDPSLSARGNRFARNGATGAKQGMGSDVQKLARLGGKVVRTFAGRPGASARRSAEHRGPGTV